MPVHSGRTGPTLPTVHMEATLPNAACTHRCLLAWHHLKAPCTTSQSPALTVALPPCLAQVTNQADGSSLLITLESKAQAKVAAAAARMRELLPPGCILSEERDVAELGSSKRRSVEMRRQQQ